MFKLDCDIKIDKYRFKAVYDVSIESGWEHLTDTCTLKLPRQLYYQNRALAFGSNPLFKRGNSVSISLGYNEELVQEFRGHLVSIHADTPIIFDIQDDMWLLKKGEITKSYEYTTLKKLLADVIGTKVPYSVTADFKLKHYGFTRLTPAQILKDLQEKYFVRSWFRAGVLYCGLAYVPSLQKEHTLVFNKHIIENSLEYVVKEDVKVAITAINVLPNGKSKKYEKGDPEGEKRTVYFYDVDEKDINTLIAREIDRYRYEGYRGVFTTFGQPSILHGDIINLYDPYFPERQGRYLVKKISKTFGMNGYRQNVELEQRMK